MSRADRKRNEQTCRICGVRLMNKEQVYCGKCGKVEKHKKDNKIILLSIVITFIAGIAIYFVLNSASTGMTRTLYYVLISAAACGAYYMFKKKL